MACFTTIEKSLKMTLPGNERLIREIWGNINYHGNQMGFLKSADNSEHCVALSEMSPGVRAVCMLSPSPPHPNTVGAIWTVW